jgi:D-glycero-D-manno-heptose 1,7-bisphosphate phosphatase
LIDRDGILNEDRGYEYVKRWEEFEFIPGVLEALAQIHRLGMPVAVVTNQSCIGKDLVSAEEVDRIHARMLEEVERSGGRIEKVYLCPHLDEDQCECRKPKPGLIRRACTELNLDPARSFFAGDSARDIKAGRAAGVATILVQTGKGVEELPRARAAHLEPDYVFDSLAQTADFLARWVRSE